MFDFLFGWRKASKCKKLIKKVQCRLKLLKNKRCTIVRQLRDDIAQLLKQSHVQIALDRVEQVFKDENLVIVYDLLDQFCEFIIINLSYIRKNKDCPNDINEAASTIVYASARVGELPELRDLRKLFEERYGQRFTNVALHLLPGNLVNRQMQEKVCLKHVPDEAKTRLLSEIARCSYQSEPLLIECNTELRGSSDKRLSIETISVNNGDRNRGEPDINKEEKESVCFELSLEAKRLLNYLALSFVRSKIVFPLIDSKSDRNNTLNTIESPVHSKKHVDTQISSIQCLENPVIKSISDNLHEEPVFLDDIQEFKSSQVKDEGNLHDLRVFMFSPNSEKEVESEYESDHKRNESRSFKKSPKIRFSIVNSIEQKHGCNSSKNTNSSSCSLDHPCYFCTSNETDDANDYSATFPTTIQCTICNYHQCSCKKNKDTKSCSKEEDCSQRNSETKPSSYVRAETMPIERKYNDTFIRSNSFPDEQSRRSPLNSHVHPKLPDYDELSAKFTALKKANLLDRTPPQRKIIK